MDSNGSEPTQRVRLQAGERLDQILRVAAAQMGHTGYHSLSLQSVADEVGITQAGLLYHVGNKERLVQLLIARLYDRENSPADFLATGDPAATHPDGISFPAFLRFLVSVNVRRPDLVRLYMALSVESTREDHPAHESFEQRPDEIWELFNGYTWRLPPDVGPFEGNRPLVERCIEAIDGMQMRWLRKPPIDMVEEWAQWEAILFPSPLWDAYR